MGDFVNINYHPAGYSNNNFSRDNRNLMRTAGNETNNIKSLRKVRHLSQAKLAELVGTSTQHLQRLESGQRRLFQDMINKLALALKCDPSDIISDISYDEKISLVGYVGVGAEIFPIDALMKGRGLEAVEVPIIRRKDISAKEILAVRVEGDSMLPSIYSGDVIYFHANNSIENCLRRRCVIRLKDGRAFIKELHIGAKPGRYNLISANASPIEDVEIEWAYKIISIEPK